jgi:uncharacterized protein YuzE|tara:strand:+ start:236 stop:595 length:360 start_codon:yes stop_codon:yes gene_type:complete
MQTETSIQNNLNKNFHYDDFSDRLMVFNKDKNEIVDDNHVLGDFIISLSKKGEVVGLEIIGISNILREYDIESKILDNLRNVELKSVSKKGAVYIYFNLISEMNNKFISQKIPLIVSLD